MFGLLGSLVARAWYVWLVGWVVLFDALVVRPVLVPAFLLRFAPRPAHAPTKLPAELTPA
jgi:hypothetical protein